MREESVNHSKWEITSAILLMRLVLGLLFAMAGWFKVFGMGAVQHGQQFFVEGYRDTWIPVFLLWTLGFLIPFLELGAGFLLIAGFRIRECLWTIGFILVVVTYGHLLKEPLYDITSHIFPRVVLVVGLLLIPRSKDLWSLDSILTRRRDLKLG